MNKLRKLLRDALLDGIEIRVSGYDKVLLIRLPFYFAPESTDSGKAK